MQSGISQMRKLLLWLQQVRRCGGAALSQPSNLQGLMVAFSLGEGKNARGLGGCDRLGGL